MKLSAAQLYRLAGLHKVTSPGGWLGVCQLWSCLFGHRHLCRHVSGSLFLSISPTRSCQRKGTCVPSVYRTVQISGMVSGLCMTQPAVSNLVAGRIYGNSVSHEASRDLEL